MRTRRPRPIPVPSTPSDVAGLLDVSLTGVEEAYREMGDEEWELYCLDVYRAACARVAEEHHGS